jgi:hypothetical protein
MSICWAVSIWCTLNACSKITRRGVTNTCWSRSWTIWTISGTLDTSIISRITWCCHASFIRACAIAVCCTLSASSIVASRWDKRTCWCRRRTIRTICCTLNTCVVSRITNWSNTSVSICWTEGICSALNTCSIVASSWDKRTCWCRRRTIRTISCTLYTSIESWITWCSHTGRCWSWTIRSICSTTYTCLEVRLSAI